MSEDPRVESALSLLLFEIGERGQATFTDPRALISLILEGADDVAADTVPVDRETLREVRAVLADWRNGPDTAFHAAQDLLRRLPDPDAGQ